MRFVIEFYNSDCLILSCFDNDDLVYLSHSDELTFPYAKLVINTKINVQYTKFKVYIENIKNKIDVFYTINDANDKVLKMHHVGYNTTLHDISPIEFQNNIIEHDQIVYEFNDIQNTYHTVVFYVRNVKYPAIPFEKYPTSKKVESPFTAPEPQCRFTTPCSAESGESQFTAPEPQSGESRSSVKRGVPSGPSDGVPPESPKVPELRESRRDEPLRESRRDEPFRESPKAPEHDMQFRFKDFERLLKTV